MEQRKNSSSDTVSNTPMTVVDFLLTKESFQLKFDEDRKMYYTYPQPNADDLPGYYDTSEYISHSDSAKGVMAFLYRRIKRLAIRRKCSLIKNMNTETGSLLDIGAGTGEFLNYAKKKGWKVTGVEPNNKARSIAIKKDLNIHESIPLSDQNAYDVITLWHVLEHLPNLDRVIQQIEGMLKKGGSLIIAVPNYNSFDAKHYREYWAAFDVPRHLWHFSKESMSCLFSDSMSLDEINPMIFDSFYVSLLSEKYKTGNNFSIKALFVGLWSNISAWRTKEYSSHVYCFRRVN